MRSQSAKRNIEYRAGGASSQHKPSWNCFLGVETGLVVGILDASGIAVKTKNPSVQGWRIKNRFDCGFAILSFIVFVLLEAALVYSYFILVRVL